MPEHIGAHALSLSLRDKVSGWSWREELMLHAHDISRPNKKIRYLAIGDSVTSASQYPLQVREFFREVGVELVLLGTQAALNDPTNRHEGYPGWKFLDFLEQRTDTPSANERASAKSPFLENRVLSFSNYIENIGGTADVVTVFLGSNDIALIDEDFESEIDRVVSNAGKLLGALAKGFPQAKIGLIFPLSPAPSQDAFGNNYGCRIPRWLYLRNVFCFREKMSLLLQTLPSNVQWIPAHLQFDCETSYPTQEQKRHALSEVTETRFCNALHPTLEGYSQIAESIFSWLISVIPEFTVER